MNGSQYSNIDDELLELELGGRDNDNDDDSGAVVDDTHNGGAQEDEYDVLGGLNEINIVPASSSSSSVAASRVSSVGGKSSYYGTDTVYSSPGQRIYNTSTTTSRKRIRGGMNGRIRRQQQHQQQRLGTITSSSNSHYSNDTDGLSEYKQYLRSGSTSNSYPSRRNKTGYSHAVGQVSEQIARCKHIARQYPQLAAGTALAFGLMMIGFCSLLFHSSSSTSRSVVPNPNLQKNPMAMMRNLMDGPQLQQVSHEVIIPIEQQQDERQEEEKVLEYRRKDTIPQQQQVEEPIHVPPQPQPQQQEQLPKPIENKVAVVPPPPNQQRQQQQQQEAEPQHIVDGDALADLLHPKVPAQDTSNAAAVAAAAVSGAGASSGGGMVVDDMTYFRGDHMDYLPHHFKNSFANVWEVPSSSLERSTDLPMFWHIPKSGGTTVADILTHCLNLVSASKIGATEGHGTDQEGILQVNTYADKGKYVNVDTSTLPGIQRAKQLGLASSGMADVVVTHRLQEASMDLFDPAHKGRIFCMFRHPVRRAISMFYYLQRASWEPTYDASLASMTLEQYAWSPKAESNWVTRFLTKEYTDKITDQHLDLAKQIMRSKMIIGILEQFDDSIKRFELYFGWWNQVIKHDPEQSIRCQQRKTSASHNKVQYPDTPETDPGYKRLEQLNWADLHLYQYALELFEEQKVLVNGKESIM